MPIAKGWWMKTCLSSILVTSPPPLAPSFRRPGKGQCDRPTSPTGLDLGWGMDVCRGGGEVVLVFTCACVCVCVCVCAHACMCI